MELSIVLMIEYLTIELSIVIMIVVLMIELYSSIEH